ncbi:MAG: TetR family transcriptional regulator [Phenylobacterium sp.]|nr:MAG: TetR family transcriptional regulator [Phenylobacterium sp.]
MITPRPGGRTARTQAVVFEAAAALLAEKDPGQLSMTEIAVRAGVAATSLYRRWGDVRTLLMEVAVERLARESPLPDTGALAGDLKAWTAAIAGSLASPGGSAFFRVYVATAPTGSAEMPGRARAIGRRLEQVQAMLDRASARGERAPGVLEVTDHLLAPLYMRALFGVPADPAFAEALVDRLLSQT